MTESVKSRVRELILSQIKHYEKFKEYKTTAEFTKENSDLHIKALDDIGTVSHLQQEGVSLEKNLIAATINLVHITTMDPIKTEDNVKAYKKAMKKVSGKKYLNNILQEL